MPSAPRWRAFRACTLLALCCAGAPAMAALPTVPEGFEARLVAAVPAVEFPSQVATAPDGSLFIAEDPMDQTGPHEADHGRILLFREGKDPVVFAEGLRAIFGMAWHDGALYVMHMPRLTVYRDTDGDGKADEAKELFKDLGPGPSGLNDHIVSGLQFGMDGYLYISVGDKGVPNAHGPDGRVVELKGGGTLRCRPDGTGMEVISTGTRNHLEPNLDDRDNLFTYDNTDDGDGWWTRVTHHVDGGYYGYAYDYHDRPDRMLPRMAEYGGGSPCGAVLYKEDVWPEKYRGVGFWAEWGKGKVHAFRFAPDGSTFKVGEAIDFAVKEGNLDFRPIDLAVSYDGRTMYVADWSMGGWGDKKQKVGRVFAITYKGEVKTRPRGKDSDPLDDQFKQLDHPSFNERMRAQAAIIKKGKGALGRATALLADRKIDPLAARHLVWVIDGIAGGTPEATAPLIDALKSPVADVRAQAARALGERSVPIATEPLVKLLADPEPTVRLQVIIALGRLGDAKAVPALLPHLAETDYFLAFSTRQALRRIGDWKDAAGGLASADAKVRAGTLSAMEGVYEVGASKALAGFAADGKRAEAERAKALEFLASAARKAKPWDGKWWGTRPTQGKPPEKVDDWEGTPIVLKTVREALADPSTPVRIAAIASVRSIGDREALPALRARLSAESDADARREVILALGKMDDKESLPLLVAILRDAKAPEATREAALAGVETLGTDLASKALSDLLSQTDIPADRQPRLIAALGKFKAVSAVPLLVSKLASPEAPVRASSAEALGKIGRTEGVSGRILPLVEDRDLSVRKAAIAALSALRDREAIPALLKAGEAEETRFEATLALTSLPDVRSLQAYLRGLADKNQELRKASAAALVAIRDEAAPALDELAARKELSPSLIPELRKVFTAMKPVMEWRIVGPFDLNALPVDPEKPIDLNASLTSEEGTPATWKLVQAANPTGEVPLNGPFGNGKRSVLAYAEVESPDDRSARMQVGSDDTLTVWLNGKQVYDFGNSRSFAPDQAQFDVKLAKGPNRLLVRSGNISGNWAFGAAVSTSAEYDFLKGPSSGGFNPDAFREFAMKGQGKADHGRALFADAKGLACVKCHAVGGQGGAVGPDLGGIGAKYPREELITSVLNPSAKILSGYEPVIVATTDGRVLTGIVKVDTPEVLEIEDADAKRIKLVRDDIEVRKVSNVSIMPAGLAEGLTPQDFADLIAYLEGLKEAAPKTGGK